MRILFSIACLLYVWLLPALTKQGYGVVVPLGAICAALGLFLMLSKDADCKKGH
ncbi:hypothetical protein [Salinimonas chungwhensis]|uniref:hypothetical protein n=1 Tax=Salinimonas chungwhensis TaxID=265425 RepID=UPI000375A31D|nr:hypothetical protein [Salinimonas chungwhensis]